MAGDFIFSDGRADYGSPSGRTFFSIALADDATCLPDEIIGCLLELLYQRIPDLIGGMVPLYRAAGAFSRENHSVSRRSADVHP